MHTLCAPEIERYIYEILPERDAVLPVTGEAGDGLRVAEIGLQDRNLARRRRLAALALAPEQRLALEEVELVDVVGLGVGRDEGAVEVDRLAVHREVVLLGLRVLLAEGIVVDSRALEIRRQPAHREWRRRFA